MIPTSIQSLACRSTTQISGFEGKLVDLDTEQQMVSEIWGFQILLDDPKHGSLFTSNFEVTPFADIWTRYPQGQPMLSLAPSINRC